MGVGQLDYSSRKPSKTQSVFFLLGTHLEGFFDTDKVLSLHGHDVVSGQVEDAQALPEKVKAKPTKSTNAVCASSNSFEKKNHCLRLHRSWPRSLHFFTSNIETLKALQSLILKTKRQNFGNP